MTQPGDAGPQRTAGFRGAPSGFALCAFVALAAVYVALEHGAHALQWLPFALLLACPLLHVFMHGRPGDHAKHAHRGGQGDTGRREGD